MLIRLSAPTGDAVPLEDLKKALRVDFDTDDDVLTALLKAQAARYEDLVGRFMLPVNLEYRADSWSYPICVPALPIRSVTEVAYLDSDHVEQVLSSSDWYQIVTNTGLEIHMTDAYAAPYLSTRPQAVRVRFAAGYDETGASGSGDDPELDPQAADLEILKLMVSKIYDHGEPMSDEDLRMIAAHRRVYR